MAVTGVYMSMTCRIYVGVMGSYMTLTGRYTL